MKKIYKLIVFVLISLFSISSFVSCSDDKEIDEWSKTYVYLQSENYLKGYNIINLSHTPIGVSGDDVLLKFNVKTQKPASTDIIVDLDFESDDFNKDILSLSSNKISIKVGENISDDVMVSINDFSPFESSKGETEYVFKIIIKNIINNEKEIEASNLLDVIECSIKKGALTNVNPTATTIEGEPIDKTTWTAEANTTYGGYSANNAIDGNNSTVWFASAWGQIPTLTVNMGSEQELNGFRISPNYTAFGKGYAIKRIEVFVSDDGEKWTSQGVSPVFSVPAGNVNEPDYKIIKFYEPITTTHFRFSLVENHTSYAGIAEIDAIN